MLVTVVPDRTQFYCKLEWMERGLCVYWCANKYKGFIEEITFHDKMAYIAPNKNKLRISTKGLEDTKENNESYFYQSRLFTMDFHNIRGKGKNQVSRSNAASWKVTGVN